MKELFEERGIANPDLDNELLSTVELGYLGSFLDKALRVGVNTYFASNQKVMFLRTQFHFTPFGQLDMNRTKLGYINDDALENLLGFSFSVEGEPIKALTLFARADYWREYVAWPEGEWSFLEDRLLSTAGAVLRLPFGLTVHLAVAYTGGYSDFLLDPESALAPNLIVDVPERTYLLSQLSYRLDLGSSRLLLGLSLFNPFGGRFREKSGIIVRNGSNFGGEVLGPRAMATARFVY
jgi:hypothetical protein